MSIESNGSSEGDTPGLPAAEYARAIEQSFRRLRRCPLLLSPADFQLVLKWHEAGIPLWLVLETVESLFSRRKDRGAASRTPLSLAYCRRAVEDAWHALQDARSGSRSRTHENEEGNKDGFEREFEENLARARGALEQARLPDAIKAAARRDLDDWAALDAHHRDALAVKDPLARIDQMLLEACRDALGSEDLAQLMKEAESETRRLAPSADAATRERLAATALARRLRTLFLLPDLTLLGLYRR